MKAILFLPWGAIRDRDDFTRKACLPLVKRIRFEMKGDALKSMISQS
jgi:hypothetical protein